MKYEFENLYLSESWLERLASLNAALISELDRFEAPKLLNGNLFYDHLQPDFWKSSLLSHCAEKRKRLFTLAESSTSFAEIGVNGGHSMFLALSANPDLKCFGFDICKQISPTWGRVDIYVPAAMRWLQTNYPGQVKFYEGDSRITVPVFTEQFDRESIDFVHIDGDKETYLQDFLNIRPCLVKNAKILIDDTNMPRCAKLAQDLVRLGLAKRVEEFPDFDHELYQNIVLQKV